VSISISSHMSAQEEQIRTAMLASAASASLCYGPRGAIAMWRTFLGFQVETEIFQHARSIIYRGRRPEDGAPVVIKVLAHAYPRPSQIAWFRREHDLLQRFDAPEIVRPLAVGFDQLRWGLVLEDAGGESLDRLLKSRRLSLPEVLVIGIQVCAALEHVHRQNVIHKDINPSNIIVNTSTLRAQLIDFGIATVLSRETPPLRNPEVLEGTLAYLSPEQTGRMNRAVDYRTDLYSLGATLYVMLTGQLPFLQTDPMELVHAHIALPPRPPSDLRSEAAGAVSDIVLKLMSKNAEDRYSSAASLKADLEECQRRWKASERIGAFRLDTHREGATFQLPQKLYGREAEAARLLAAFDRASRGATELLVVSGYSGIGKSALVQEIYRPVTQSRGYYVAGKFDQLQREVPYASIVQAFRSLLRQWLTESQPRVAGWRAALQVALGVNARVLVDVIPELGVLLGDTPPAPELAPAEAQIRFHRVLDAFIQVVARPEHPLVLFLDDLQWVDAASLSLLKQILLAPELGHLLVIGAYRDNEVTPAHPLMLAIDEIRRGGAAVTGIVLRPLDLANLRHLLADTLGTSPEDTTALAELLLAKTQGNPFFARELLRTLHAEGLLAPGQGEGGAPRFTWDLRQIRAVQITDNVVDLMASKIGHLPEATRRVLMLAAAYGNEVDLRGLALSHGRSQRETAEDLWPALEAGLVIPLDDAYQVAALDVEGLEDSLRVRYRFAHDRIQQAAYASIPASERAAVHWGLGRKLEARSTPAEREERLFDIVQHLNSGSEQARSAAERDELAELNLRAARRAKGSAAFRAANEHARTGLSLLGDGGPGRRHELWRALAEEAAESAYVITDYEQMDGWIDLVLRHAKDDLDTLKVHETRIHAMNARLKPLEAIETARSFLRRIGITLPLELTMADVQKELARTRKALEKTRVRDLERLPGMTAPKMAAAVRIMARIYSSAYIASPLLFIVMVLKQVRLVAKYGNTAASPLAYGVYGLLLAGLADDVRAAYQFGTLADRLKERPDAAPFRAQATHLFNCHTRFWAEPLEECSRGEARAYQIGLETGELEYGCYGAHVSSKYAYMHGAELGALRVSMGQYTEAMRRHGQHIAWTSHASWEQAVTNLSTPVDRPWELCGPAFDEEEMFPRLEASKDRMAISNAWLNKLLLSYMFGRWDDAVAAAETGAGYLDSVLSQMDVPLHGFYEALSRLARCGPDAGAAERRAVLRGTAAGVKRLEKWARRSPQNFAHKHALLSAERARVAGDDSAARELYDRAAALAREARFLSEEALAYEVAARFYLGRGQPELARHYLQDAHYAYLRWGAVSKVRHLRATYPQLISLLPLGGDTIPAGMGTVTTTQQTGSSMLDLATVIKASQTIAGEVVIVDLLRRLMRIVMENAGAQRAALLLEHAGDLYVEAEGEIGSEEVALLGMRHVEASAVSAAVIRYAARTREPLVLDDAPADPRFAADPHVATRRPRSVLCQPIVNQGKLIGVLYLENLDAAGAFTPERVELLGLLSGQIAVSIDNARLYETLERKVAERTEQLELRNRFIRETFGRYLSDDIVESLLETPEGLSLGGAKRNVTIMMTDLRGFTSLTETLPAEKVVAMLNSYLSVMTGVILRYQGTIDEFIGDAILAIFGAPLWRPDHAEKAVACALEMQLAMGEVNRRNRELGLPELTMGIGLNTGEVVVGNIGSEKRAKYGVVGLNVNLASRIESYTVGGQVLIAESTKVAVSAPLRIDSTLVVQPKGVKQPIAILEVGGIGEPYGISLPVRVVELVTLAEPIDVRFTVLRGKDSIGEVVSGRIERLGDTEVEMSTRAPIPALSDLRIGEASTADGWIPLDVYGKIAARKAEGPGCQVLSLTSVPDEARAFFRSVLERERGVPSR
jgi:predicted ATPase/class 3 adenylate cyclase/putative methionine-R-sulfoxide reductase with GAF domain